jgi:hypothetical protein
MSICSFSIEKENHIPCRRDALLLSPVNQQVSKLYNVVHERNHACITLRKGFPSSTTLSRIEISGERLTLDPNKVRIVIPAYQAMQLLILVIYLPPTKLKS